MSKYNRFEDFMQTVINEADRKCRLRRGESLTDAFKVHVKTADIIKDIIDKGWWVLVALVGILSLGFLGFGAAIVAFCSTPAGIIVLAVLGGTGIAGVRELYKNRILPKAVKSTGDLYKDEFYRHINEVSYIDSMVNRASDNLLARV